MSAEETKPKAKRSLMATEFEFNQPEILKRFVTDTGKMLPRRITRLSAKEQRAITRAIKRSRNMLIMQ
ncbi:MAG: 30S ribosomal protein S18 [Opitutales bacterium]|nr:30S ribosomal protein S18 [Opitutales bacterium]MCH8474097.1 30S ribosomal protein S18 [Opitutales bacterium]MCH8539667.1 30S ribosomal protein S18 [Opitutales bacterium]